MEDTQKIERRVQDTYSGFDPYERVEILKGVDMVYSSEYSCWPHVYVYE